MRGVEVDDLAGDLAVDPAGVEVLDGAHAGLAAHEARPERLDVVAQRRHRAHAGDHYAARHVISLPVRIVAARYTSPGRPRCATSSDAVAAS